MKKHVITIILWIYSIISPIVFMLGVFFIGFITPNYSHLSHTISRLGIEKYAWLQNINLIQFAIGLLFSGILFWQVVKNQESKRVWLITFLLYAGIILLTIIFPTDPIDNVRFSFDLLSPSGLIHFGTIITLFILSPWAYIS